MAHRESVLEGLVTMFWQGKRVFLTGHTGFKGAWLSLWLAYLGADVTGYALKPPTSPSLYDLAGLDQRIHSHIADIRDLEALNRAMAESQPEIAVHMAAQSLVRPSYTDPVYTYETNIMGTVHFLEVVRRTPGIRAALVVTSDKCYQNDGEIHTEGDPMGGRDPYASSKGCAELITAAYRDSYFSAYEDRAVVAAARAGNVIGGGDWAADRLLPDCIRALENGTPIPVRNPRAIRPWQHVLDCLQGYLLLIEKLYHDGPAYAGAYNFGPGEGEAHTVEWVAGRVCAAWGRDASYTVDREENAPPEAPVLRLDSTKSRRELGWEPKLPAARAIDWTMDWYKRYKTAAPAALCEEQIRAYMEE